MKLIKLDAIDSTNDFLKALASQDELENFTTVTAENQTKGKGQVGGIWKTQAGKNLTMSVLVKDFLFNNDEVFNLSLVVSLSVAEVLKTLNIPDICIKWPNDILSYNKKLVGILIENTLKSDGRIVSVAGIGINVNQTDFAELPTASSMAVIAGKSFDKEELAVLIVEKLKEKIHLWNTSAHLFWEDYLNFLFKKGIPTAVRDNNNNDFMGIIQGVSPMGKLQVLLEDDSVAEFEIKEVKMLY